MLDNNCHVCGKRSDGLFSLCIRGKAGRCQTFKNKKESNHRALVLYTKEIIYNRVFRLVLRYHGIIESI